MKDSFHDGRTDFSQTYFLSRVVKDAKRPSKISLFIRKTGLTRFGGLSLLQSFCKSLGLRRFLQLYVRWPDYHYRDYHPADLFLAHLFAIMAGTGRVESTQCLIHNGLIPPILGLSEFGDGTQSRQCAPLLWRLGFPGLYPGETPFLDCFHSHPGAARWSLLRQDLFRKIQQAAEKIRPII